MAAYTSEVLDLSKENIQPLRYGRKASHLKIALQAQTDVEIQQKLFKQREEFEYLIRTYDGDDPLDLYYKYVDWLEQSYPNLKETNLIPLLENIITKFKDCDRYKQDNRFAQLLVKYINAQTNPLELYQIVYNHGLATMCSILYKSWAEEFDKNNDFKRADQVFQMGLSCRAQPLTELQDAHIQFQLSIARRMLEGNIEENKNIQSNELSSRTILSRLQPSKVKSNRLSKDSAGIFQSAHKNESKSYNPLGYKFKVYQEDENDDSSVKSDLKYKFEKLPKGSITDRENVMKPSRWCDQKLKQLPGVGKPNTPLFSVHEDPDADCDGVKKNLRPQALKIKKTELKCPIAVFEPPDQLKKPIYANNLDENDYSSVKSDLKYKVENLSIGSIADRENVMKPNILCDKKLKQLPGIGKPRTPLFSVHEDPDTDCDGVKKNLKPQALKIKETEFNCPIAVFEPPDPSKKPMYAKNLVYADGHDVQLEEIRADYYKKIAENEKIPSTTANIGISDLENLPTVCSPSTSMTVHTRNATDIVQEMWSSPSPSSNIHKINDLLTVPFTEPKIKLTDNEFGHENLPTSMNSLKINRDDYVSSELPRIIPVNLFHMPLEPENKENIPPKNYSTPSDKRPLSGILTPATDIPFREVENEESDDDDDECCKIYNKDNQIDDQTCNTQAFAIPLLCSTPFSRQINSFHDNH